MSRARSVDFKLQNVRISYPYLLQPRVQKNDNGTETKKFSAVLMWPKEVKLVGKTANGDDLDVMAEAARIAGEDWGEKAAEWVKSGLIKNPFLDGDGPQGMNKKTGERLAGYAGMRFIRPAANADRPPEVFDDKRGADGKLVKITDPRRIYPGCYVHAVVNLYTWQNDKGGRGVSFGLNMVQFAKDGERLGGDGGPNPDKFFEGAASAPESVKTGAGGAADLFA